MTLFVFPGGLAESKPKYMKVKDKSRNKFSCPLDAVTNLKLAAKEELPECVEDEVAERNAGGIEKVGELGKARHQGHCGEIDSL